MPPYHAIRGRTKGVIAHPYRAIRGAIRGATRGCCTCEKQPFLLGKTGKYTKQHHGVNCIRTLHNLSHHRVVHMAA